MKDQNDAQREGTPIALFGEECLLCCGQTLIRCRNYVRRAASASSASSRRRFTMPVFWLVTGSKNSLSALRPLTAATAPFRASLVGRTIETGPSDLFRKNVGSGMIKLVCSRSAFVAVLRLGKDRFWLGSEMLGAFPALSCQVWKCMASVGPMLSRTRRTSRLLTF